MWVKIAIPVAGSVVVVATVSFALESFVEQVAAATGAACLDVVLSRDIELCRDGDLYCVDSADGFCSSPLEHGGDNACPPSSRIPGPHAGPRPRLRRRA